MSQQEEAQARLVSYMLSFLQEHERDDELVELEASNLVAALEAAITLRMPRELIALTLALVPFLERRGRYVLADQYLRQAYEAAVALGEPLSQLRLLEHLARVAGQRGELSLARRLGQESRASYETLGHHQAAAEVTDFMHTLSSLDQDAPLTTAEHAPGPDLPGW